MESLINYYYGINPINIQKYPNYYLIKNDNNIYLLVENYEDINNLKKIINYLNQTNIKYHLLVMTKDNNLFITYESKNYCLFKVRTNPNDKISLFKFNTIKLNGVMNWPDIWSKRIDYYEKQVEEIIKDEGIKSALQYYIGLTEIAISYANKLKEINYNNLNYTITHQKISCPIDYLNYYNPLNMLIDLNVRDIAEYLKSAFFNEILTESEILQIIDQINYNEYNANYLFIRLLYPSYFFNLYDNYIETKNIDNQIFLIIKKSNDYESLLSKIYNRLVINNKLNIKLWFIKYQH